MKRIATLDCETDPFKNGRIIAPFTWDFFDGETHFTTWGENCTHNLMLHIASLDEKFEIFGHNGGKFDFLFLTEYMLDQKPKIINGRVVKWIYGGHELRDSYAILPVPLKQGGEKLDISYSKLEHGRREQHKQEIIRYMRQDCVALYNMVSDFKKNLGNGLTMAGVATKLLKEMTPKFIEKLTLDQDKDIRQFFFGGRVECFEKGIIKDVVNINDVRSMYPFVMASQLHPIGSRFVETTDFDDKTDFAIVDCYSRGAFPLRDNAGNLQFPHSRAEYRVTGHELRAAIDLNLIDIYSVKRAIRCLTKTTFEEFILKYSALRQAATLAGDEVGKLHYKLVQNSSYGRFALNPDKLFDWQVLPVGVKPPAPWEPAHITDKCIFWKKPVDESTKIRAISNVATGASITGAARAKLLYAIHTADRPYYCDTDSVICRKLNQPGDDGSLGQWQHEGQGDKIAIAAKKLYAVFGAPANDVKENKKRKETYGDIHCIKLASKGVRLTAKEIIRVASGDVIRWDSIAPTMKLNGSQHYMHRNVRMN